jgi:hypothetical protein
VIKHKVKKDRNETPNDPQHQKACVDAKIIFWSQEVKG